MAKYSYVRQDDQSDCGVAALATIAQHYGKSLSVQKLRQSAGTDRMGTNLVGLLRAAEDIGFIARGVKGPYEGLTEITLPAIAHTVNEHGEGHFVVLHQISSKGVVVADPAKGILKLSQQDFSARWTGYLLLVEPDASKAGNGDTVPSPRRRLQALLWMFKAVLAEAFLCALLMTLLGLSTSYFVQILVDSVLVQGEKRLLNALGIGMLLVLIFRSLFSILRQYLLAFVSRRIDLGLIAGYARHLFRLPTSFFEMRQVGEIISRVHDATKIREAISGTALTIVVDAVMVLISVIVLWFYDWPLAAVATAFVPLLFISVLLHLPTAKRLSRQAMEEQGAFSANLVEGITGVDTIKSFSLERERSQICELKLVKVIQSVFSLQMLGISMSTIGIVVNSAAGLAILWYGGHRVIAGELTVGQLLFFYTLLGYMLGPLERLASANLGIQDALVAMDRLYQIMDLETEGDQHANLSELHTIQDGIELRDVEFQYGCRDTVLKGINMRIPAGSRVAIVGQSGCGKSTLLKLLTRKYDPTQGKLIIDGVDLRDYQLDSIRQKIGVVEQEPFVFSGSLYDNVAMGNPNAGLSDVARAIAAADLERFVSELPQRYETLLGERGANLSGGQKQRLAIARALVRQPEVLVFDEATSHLDTATERAIQRGLEREFVGKTVIMVAHRLSTIRDADIICVMDQGRIVQQGTHDELVAQAGLYAELWAAQLGSPKIGPVLSEIGLPAASSAELVLS